MWPPNPFWTGVGVGVFIGFFAGVIVVSLAVISRESDERAKRIAHQRQKFEGLS